jgi:hypothetical protein
VAVKRSAHLSAGTGWTAFLKGSPVRGESRRRYKKAPRPAQLREEADAAVQAIEDLMAEDNRSRAETKLGVTVLVVKEARGLRGHQGRVARLRLVLEWLARGDAPGGAA